MRQLKKCHLTEQELLEMERASFDRFREDAERLFEIGHAYLEGEGGKEQDYEKAYVLFDRAAIWGNADAMNNLGYMLQHGLGVEVDVSKAFRWYEKAAKFGHAEATSNLGVCYATGIGVEKDLTRAIELFQKAIDGGFTKASAFLQKANEEILG